MNKQKIGIVLPALNEQAVIPHFLQSLDSVLSDLTSTYEFEVIVVDDGSTDGTADAINQFSANSFSTTLIQFTRNFGKESAIMAGLEHQTVDATIIMDCDQQHPPELIPEMLERWNQGFSVVECLKTGTETNNPFYQYSSNAFYFLLASISNLNLKNLSDFKLLDHSVVEQLCQLPEKQRFFRGLVEWSGYRKCQIPFSVPDRLHGETSWSTMKLFRYSIRAITSFSSAPLHLITIMGILMMALSLIVGTVSVVQWISGIAVTGFTTVNLLLLIIGSLIMFSIGLIGLYLSHIYEEIKGRPLYIIDSKEPIDTSDSAANSEETSRGPTVSQATSRGQSD